MSFEARRLSWWDTLRLQLHVSARTFLLGVVVPNRLIHSLAARGGGARRSMRFLDELRQSYGEHAWTRFPLRRTLIVFAPSTVETVFTSDANAADPTLKRRALSRFAPDSLVISSGDAWIARRAFNESALDLDRPLRHGDTFAGIAHDEARALLDPPRTELRWRDFQALAQRISHRVVLGNGAADDGMARHLARMLPWSNLLLRNVWAYHRFYRRLGHHLAAASPRAASKCLIDAEMARDSENATSIVRVPSQIGFWMFVLKDAIELHAARTLALVAAHPDVQARARQEILAAGTLTPQAVDGLHYLEACIMEQLRLWTPVPLLLRRVREPMSLGDGIVLREGDQILFHAGFHHRDPRAFGGAADRFVPDAAFARAPSSATYVFSAHRQRCAGRTLALFVLKATLASLLSRARFELEAPSIEPASISHLYDHFSLRLRALAVDVASGESTGGYGESSFPLQASRS